MPHEDLENPPAGYVRFNMIRNAENPDEVVCFGFFDGTVDELRRSAAEQGYAAQIAPFVEYVGADGLYEIVEEYAAASSAAA